MGKEIQRIHSVFDQRSLMSGTGLLIKIMRQFASIYESKEFYLVKNGQVGQNVKVKVTQIGGTFATAEIV